MHRAVRVTTVSLVLVLALGACGSSGSKASPSTVAATTPAATAAPTTVASVAQTTAAATVPATPTTTASTSPAVSGTLTIASWGGVSDEVSGLFATGFQKDSGVSVKFEPVPGQEVAGMQAQAQSGKILWDIGDALGQDQTAALGADGLLDTLPADVKANLEKSMPGAVKAYGIGYGSLSNVIACNSAVATKCPTTPAEFFDTTNFPGKRTLWADGPLVAITMALVADGVPRDKLFPLDLDRAFKKLATIKGSLDVLYTTGDQIEQLFRSGEVAMGVIFNGRAFTLATDTTSSNLKVQVSWDGAVYSPTELAVYKNAPNKEAAYAYLEWVASHPDVAAQYSAKSTYGFPNQKIFDTIDPKLGAWLPEDPSHFTQRIDLDYTWYLANQTEVDSRWKDFTTG